MRTYASSRKERAFIENVNSRCFVDFRRPYWCTKTVHQYGTKLFKGAWNVSANNSETVGHKDLRQIVYILVFYNSSFSWLLPLDGFQFIFMLRDGENDLYTKHGSEFANWPLKRGRWMSRGEKAAQQIFDFLYWPSECFRHGLSIKVERKDVSKHRESCKARTGWHVSKLVEHHQVMKKEQQK